MKQFLSALLLVACLSPLQAMASQYKFTCKWGNTEKSTNCESSSSDPCEFEFYGDQKNKRKLVTVRALYSSGTWQYQKTDEFETWYVADKNETVTVYDHDLNCSLK
ncbi:MAG: hypothetical protein K2X47_03000 [Bdellovibrionales bacterium]|nr:hypothetical protein [Bdellovibrionales bacterium]